MFNFFFFKKSQKLDERIKLIKRNKSFQEIKTNFSMKQRFINRVQNILTNVKKLINKNQKKTKILDFYYKSNSTKKSLYFKIYKEKKTKEICNRNQKRNFKFSKNIMAMLNQIRDIFNNIIEKKKKNTNKLENSNKKSKIISINTNDILKEKKIILLNKKRSVEELNKMKNIIEDLELNLELRLQLNILQKSCMIEKLRLKKNENFNIIQQKIFFFKKLNQVNRSNRDKIHGIINSDFNLFSDILYILKKEKFKNVIEKYRKKNLEAQTIQIINNDLNIFHRILDQTLLKFHKEKMKKINIILKELWQTTYIGNDIDYIQINSEGKNLIKKNRVYNYCVVMIQGKAKLQMRGHCSLGQKVLASLLIRLSLAETFCLNCGIITLDEPTTNLDRVNIKALVKVLITIIKRKKNQNNFQIICITHNEDFMEYLGQHPFCDYYYRVFKNKDQKSVINRFFTV